MTQAISIDYKKKRLRIAKSFVSWLAEKGFIPVPPNLHSRRQRFGGGARVIATIPVEEVRRLISNAPGQLQLHLLLMINCGMTQVDISDLSPGEVDWNRGRIRRKRGKTADHESVPTVDYPLWSETWSRLRVFGRRDGDRVLLIKSGQPWVRDRLLDSGKRSKVDAIKSNYRHLQRVTSSVHPMKLFRKTSASVLETDGNHARYTLMFLRHAPKTVADRHYVVPSQANFDRAIEFLRRTYNIQL